MQFYGWANSNSPLPTRCVYVICTTKQLCGMSDCIVELKRTASVPFGTETTIATDYFLNPSLFCRCTFFFFFSKGSCTIKNLRIYFQLMIV